MGYTMVAVSSAHTFGNVTAFVTEYIKQLFPEGYFRTVNIASSIAYRHFNIFNSTNKEFIKKNKPMLIIRPRVDPMNQDTYLNGTLLTQRMTDNKYDYGFGNLQPFIHDKEKGIYVRYLMNRIKMYFDVTMIFESQIEQLNQVIYLKNAVRQEHPFYIDCALESIVPSAVMDAISKDSEVAISPVKDFLSYLNSHSNVPVTYKMKNASGNEEFFRYYPVQIDSLFTGLSIDDGSKNNLIDDAFPLNFTISTEFETVGLYYYFTKNVDTLKNLSIAPFDLGFKDGNQYYLTPMYTVIDLFDKEMPAGWDLYSVPMFKVSASKGEDSLDISSLLNQSLKTAIQYHLDNNLPVDPMINITVMRDNTELDASKNEYTVDYANLQVITRVLNLTSTYRLIIKVNTLYINNLVGNILDIDEQK